MQQEHASEPSVGETEVPGFRVQRHSACGCGSAKYCVDRFALAVDIGGYNWPVFRRQKSQFYSSESHRPGCSGPSVEDIGG